MSLCLVGSVAEDVCICEDVLIHKCGLYLTVLAPLKETPLSIPSPSNQWASRPRSALVTGLPPFLIYSPLASSSGIDPVKMQLVSGRTRWMGAKFPWRYGWGRPSLFLWRLYMSVESYGGWSNACSTRYPKTIQTLLVGCASGMSRAEIWFSNMAALRPVFAIWCILENRLVMLGKEGNGGRRNAPFLS